MKRQLFIAISLTLLSPAARAESQPWWQGDGGYASTGGFHSELNKGKPVGTPMVNAFSNVDEYQKYLEKQKLNPTTNAALPGESEAERLIRVNQLDKSLVPDPRKETIGPDKTSPGQLGWDEKLVDARTLAATGKTGEDAQALSLAIDSSFGGSIAAVCGTDKNCETRERDKVNKQLKVYEDNAIAFEKAKQDYGRGISRLTRDYYKLEPKGPTGGGQAGSLVTGSVKYDDAAAGKREAMIQAQVDKLSPEKLAMFEERGIDAEEFVGKFLDGEFKSFEDIEAFLGENEGSDKSLARGDSAETGSETGSETARETASAEDGPVLNVQNGSFISFGPKKGGKGTAAGGNGAGDDDKSLMNALANFIGAQAKGLQKAAGGGDEITDNDRRALLDFAVTWWKTQDKVAPAIPEGQRQRTIFDVAHDSYSTFRGTRAVKPGPVAFNNR